MSKETSIHSLQNPFVKHLVRLRQERRYRHEQRRVVIEGRKLIAEICSETVAEILCCCDPASLPSTIKAKEICLVSASIMRKISGLESPEGILAVVPMPRESRSLQQISRLLVLDGISDPGNMGTLLRTASALGWDAVAILPNSCDPFNDKALRAAQGAMFHLQLFHTEWSALHSTIKDAGLRLLAADLSGVPIEKSVISTEKVALILGNEGAGISDQVSLCCEKIKIPMAGKMESLNVGTAGGILMYLLSGL